MCISNLKAKSSITEHWSLWNFKNCNGITHESTYFVVVCTKVLHSFVSNYRAKREFIKTDTSGNIGILNNFPVWPKSHYSPWYFISLYWSCWPLIFKNKKDKMRMLWTGWWRKDRKLLLESAFFINLSDNLC